MRPCLSLLLLAVPGAAFAAQPESPAALRADAASIEALINDNYAFLDRLPGGRFTLPAKLRDEGRRVATKRDLVVFSERALSLLADHHAITGSSTATSWAVFPSFADLWVKPRGRDFVIEQVRKDSPAERAGVRAGDRLTGVDGVPIAAAVAAFWANRGTTGGGVRDEYAAGVLAAGRRDRPRSLALQRGVNPPRTISLLNLYQWKRDDLAPVSTSVQRGKLFIRINDALGSDATIAAFDAAMAGARPRQPIVIDLRDTPGGGNTTIARAILGWFVTRPTFYQMHSLPAEERRTGIPRQWVEQVLPRRGKYHPGPVVVRVGRWTGSMGEGLAIGFAAAGARVEGSRMAGLLGAVYDYRLPASGLVLKIPTERLYTPAGLPRERFVPGGATSPR